MVKSGEVTISHSDPVRGWMTGLEVTSPQPAGGVTSSTFSFSHDAYGRTQSQTLQSGSALKLSSRTTSFGYDGLDRLSSITSEDGATWGYDYDAVGNKTTLVRPNGTVTGYAYDELNRLTNMATRKGTLEQVAAGTAPLVSRFDYHLRDDGRRDGLSEQVVQPDGTSSIRTAAYEFDDANRLTGESGKDGEGKSYSKSYTLDSAGNRTASSYTHDGQLQAQTTYAYNSLDWLNSTSVQSASGTSNTSFGYDANGSQTSQTTSSGTQASKWDFEGHLLAQGGVDANGNWAGNRTGYAYDASGMRLTQAHFDAQGALTKGTSYVWNGDRVAEERDEKGVLQGVYEHGQELGPLRLRRLKDGAWQNRFFVGDGQDSTRQLMNEAGVVTDSYFYDSFGNGLNGGQGQTLNPFKYAGQQQDESGLYYLRARYYNAGTGRFLSHDPEMGSGDDPISMHRYLYAGADAVNGVDPTGRETLTGMNVAMGIGQFLLVNAAFGAGTSVALPEAREMSLGARAASGAWGATAGLFELVGQVAYNHLTFNDAANAQLGLQMGAGLIQWHIDLWNVLWDKNTTGIQKATAGAMLIASALSIAKMARGAVKTTPGQKVAGYMRKMGREFMEEDGARVGEGPSCFVAGTLVVMADGSKKPIEQVKKDDWVLSRDAKTGKTAAKRVVRLLPHQAPATLVLHFKNGERIETTKPHPFYVQGRGFVPAGEMGIGTSIVTRAGPPVQLTNVELKDRPVAVYNFEVEDFHTYFVGHDALWVHNACKIEPYIESDFSAQEEGAIAETLIAIANDPELPPAGVGWFDPTKGMHWGEPYRQNPPLPGTGHRIYEIDPDVFPYKKGRGMGRIVTNDQGNKYLSDGHYGDVSPGEDAVWYQIE